MRYIPAIGLEVHVQLLTRSKMFCGCRTDFGAPPNTQVCPVCLGYPGTLPVINAEAVRLTVMSGLMLGSRISGFSKFDRKNYFYPDMPKNYQISQYDMPLCVGGQLEVESETGAARVRINRIHLEEDVGKSMHGRSRSSLDFNRAGVPLMEIVTEPDMSSADEAQDFLLALKQILVYGGISHCNLEQGNLRCDINCSLRPEGQQALGVKTEIKNMNTFKGIYHALRHEIDRQIEVLEAGDRVVQETRRWDADTGAGEPMRSKEEVHDYRFFPDPDLMPIVLSREQIEDWGRRLPELPRRRRERLAAEYGLPEYDAKVLAADKDLADFFEAAARRSSTPKLLSNWLMTDMLRLLGEKAVGVADLPMTPQALADLVRMVETGVVNVPSARKVFAVLVEKGGDPAALVRDMGLTQVRDAGALETLAEQAIAGNPKSVADFKAGKQAAMQFLVGQVMRLSMGKADPQRARDILRRKLSG